MAIFKCLMLLFIISCTHLPTKQRLTNVDNEDHHDIDEHDYSLQQYNTSLESNEPAIPEIMPLPIEFPDLTISNQLISINVSEEVSVKDLLIEIGKLSDVNLDIDPKISGNIILKLKDKNINEVIQSIANS
ncbi:MAG: secretion system protein, partial [Wolbachia sp.]